MAKDKVYVTDTKYIKPSSRNHYRVEINEEFLNSIRSVGIIEPGVVREIDDTDSDYEYELISGHRRLEACKQLGIKMPIIIKDISDDEADILMVDANNYRDITVMERAIGYVKKYIALLHMHNKIESREFDPSVLDRLDPEIIEKITKENDIANIMLRKYFKLTTLPKDIQDKLDEGKLTIDAGYFISFLTEETKQSIAEYLKDGNSLTEAQAKLLKDDYKVKNLSISDIKKILSKKKPAKPAQIKLVLNAKYLSRYFDKDKSSKDMEKIFTDILNRAKEEGWF